MIRFSDGMEFDTSGPARPVHKSDGWYVVGKGFLIPCDNAEQAQQEADRLNAKKD